MKEYLHGEYPGNTYNKRLANNVVSRVKSIKIPKISSLKELEIEDLIHQDVELDFLFYNATKGKSTEVIKTIPLVGCRLSSKYSPFECYAITNSLRKKHYPEIKNLYFLTPELFVEADRVLKTLPEFAEEIEYDPKKIQNISDVINQLTS
jgi:hypothetical protein